MAATLRPSMKAILAFVLVMLALWATIYVALLQSRRIALEDAATMRTNLARSLAEFEASSIRAIDIALVFLRDQWRGDPVAFGEQVQRYEGLVRKENVIQVAVVDADGWLRYSRLPQSGPPIDFSDRDYFRVQKASGKDQLHISEPVLGRITGQWAIQITRPLLDGDGRFAGVVVVAVPPPALEMVYHDITLGAGGVVTLARADGKILARSSDFERTAGRSIAPPEVRAGPGPSGEFRGRGTLDGVERFISYRRIDDYPLVVFVGQGVDAVLAPYRQHRAILLGIGAAASLLIAWLLWVLVSRERERARFEEERERLMLELHDGCIQSIYAVGLNLQHCRNLPAAEQSRADEAIAQAAVELNLVIQDLRAFITGEHRRLYTPEQFVAEIDRVLPASRAPEFSLDIDHAVVSALTTEQQGHVLRIVREAASNVVRHAHAATGRIRLARDADRIVLEIADDGRGVGEAARPGGLGVAHIHSRARKLRGSARVESAPAAGTRVRVDFPVRP